MRFSMLFLVLAIAVLMPVAASASETHIFFGEHGSEIDDEWLDTSGPMVQVGDGYYVAGDLAEGTSVLFQGNEVDVRSGSGVALSQGEGFQVGGGTGSIYIEYPSGVGVIEVVFMDAGTPVLSGGCALTTEVRASSFGPLKTLDLPLGGDTGKLNVKVRQFFQPAFSGELAGLETTIKLIASGYDEITIERISLYSSYVLRSNTTFLDGAKGRKTRVLHVQDSELDDVSFADWVRNPLKRLYEGTAGASTTREAGNHPQRSPEGISGEQLITRLTFDEGAGNLAENETSFGVVGDGVLGSGGTFTAKGKFYGALLCRGTEQRCDLSYIFGNDIPRGTIRCWFKADELGPGCSALWGKESDLYHRWKLCVSTAGFTFEMRDGSIHDLSGSYSFIPGQWYMIAARWGPPGMRVEINGILVASNGFCGSSPNTGRRLPFTIGQFFSTASGREFNFVGCIDEFGFFADLSALRK